MNKKWFTLAGFVLLIAGIAFFYPHFFKKISNADVSEVSDSAVVPAADDSNSAQEKMGTQMNPSSKSEATSPALEAADEEDQKVFSFILTDMIDCLDLTAAQPPEAVPLQSNQILSLVNTAAGVPAIEERWRSWNFKTKDGTEQTLRLENNEDEFGIRTKKLSQYRLDENHQIMTLLTLPPELSGTPNDENINGFLKDKNLAAKERSTTAFYKQGDRVDFIERDGVLQEVEILKGETLFRCPNLKSRESCQCVR